MELPAITFANLLREYPILFSKSQLPSVRKDKSNALQELKIKLEAMCGKTVEISAITKKINNMKMRVKQKCDLNKTGNKAIVLKEWEKIIHELLDGDTNPAISRIPGGYSFGVMHEPFIVLSSEQESEAGSQRELTESFESLPLVASPETPPASASSIAKRKRNAVDEYETECTKGLSNSELQRLVLLKQLQVLELKEKKLRRELDM